MDLVKTSLLTLLLLAGPAPGHAQSLSLTIGNAVAGRQAMFKNVQFVFRVNGCADLSKAQVTANAEGIAAGSRKKLPLRLYPLDTPGVYAVSPQWGSEGTWVIAIAAACLNETAGAIVPVTGSSGFNRESTQLLTHAPAQDEIEAALKARNK